MKNLLKWILSKRGSILGDTFSLFGKSKKSEGWRVDPYIEELRKKYDTASQPSFYSFTQPDVEAAVEQKLLGRLGRNVSDIAGQFGAKATAPYYQAAKERMQEGFGEEQAFAKDIFQREGVLTSTPGIQGQIDLRRKQGQEVNEFSQKLMYEDIAREIEATKAAEDIIGQDISQGTMLGGMQRGYQKWPYDYANQVLLSSPQLTGQYYSDTKPGTLQKIGTIMNNNDEQLMALLKMIGMGGA